MAWFPSQWAAVDGGWKFDIVSLLAVIGGSTIDKHKQAITASRLGVIPRLLPAPNTLLNTDRPRRLPSVTDVTVCGVGSGIHTSELSFFANMIHQVESLQDYEFRTCHIRYTHPVQDVEQTASPDDKATISVRTCSMLNAVTVVSILMTLGLSAWALVIHDGVALIGLVSMSLSTSAACCSAQWRPRLSKRSARNKVPHGDVSIKTRGGAFIIVHCTENITRELYLADDSCGYMFHGKPRQLLLSSSTILLMAAILFFSNCGRTMQIAVGVAYIILNGLYWAIPLVRSPEHDAWDINQRYTVEWDKKKSVKFRSFTEVLWCAIYETQSIHWAKRARIAPNTIYWDQWLNEAFENCTDPSWDAVGAKNRWMDKAAQDEKNGTKGDDLTKFSLDRGCVCDSRYGG